jgi:hypothetical protein
MPRVDRYRYDARGKGPFGWVPGCCCALPAASCCLIWAGLLALSAILISLAVLRHLFF